MKLIKVKKIGDFFHFIKFSFYKLQLSHYLDSQNNEK